MVKKLWEARPSLKTSSNLYKYEKFISKKYSQKFNQNYKKLLNWSIKNSDSFWSTIWDFCEVKGVKGKKKNKEIKYFL